VDRHVRILPLGTRSIEGPRKSALL
jgi:hypothetical protein